jgi:hypothetical protein
MVNHRYSHPKRPQYVSDYEKSQILAALKEHDRIMAERSIPPRDPREHQLSMMDAEYERAMVRKALESGKAPRIHSQRDDRDGAVPESQH